MILLACHKKVESSECTINHFPDLGNYLGIKNFFSFYKDIKKLCTSRVELILVHEGHFYVNTLLAKIDENIDAYLEKIQLILKQYPYIKSMALKDFSRTRYL